MNENLIDLILWAAEDKKAQEVCVIDLPNDFAVADKFVICSGSNSIQVKAIAERIIEVCKENEHFANHVEGMPHGMWILIDFADIVVHIFTNELREFYNLERLWQNKNIDM